MISLSLIDSHATNGQRNVGMWEAAVYWRNQFGELTCKYNDVGVNGGYCLKGRWNPLNPRETRGHVEADAGLAQTIVEYLGNTSIIDIGAGIGQYGLWFKENKIPIDWKGYDGAENVESYTNGFVKWIDATDPIFDTISSKSDWVMSFEVGEHIPLRKTEAFLQTLDRHNTKGIILSWAVPGQGGLHHVNLRHNLEIKQMLNGMGYSQDNWCKEFESQGRISAKHPWFRNSFMVFKKVGS